MRRDRYAQPTRRKEAVGIEATRGNTPSWRGDTEIEPSLHGGCCESRCRLRKVFFVRTDLVIFQFGLQ